MGHLKTIAETAKTVLQASNVGRSSQLFSFVAVPSFQFRTGRGAGAFGSPQNGRLKKTRLLQLQGETSQRQRGSLLSNHSRQRSGKKKRLSLSPRYEFKSRSIKATPCALSGEAKTLHKQLRKITSDPWVLQVLQAYHFDFTEIPL